MFKRYIKKSLARSVANWVRMVGTVGTVHGYGTWVRWVRWQSTWVRYNRYGARTQTFTQHPYPHPTTVPNTNSRNRTQQYPTPVPVPNTRTQHPYPHPTTVPNTNSRNRTQQYPTPVPVPNTRTQHPYPTPVPVPNTRTEHPYPTSVPVPVPVPIEMTPRTLRNRLNREAWFHCFQKLIIYIYIYIILPWKSRDSKRTSSWKSVESGSKRNVHVKSSWCTFWGPGPQKERCYKHPVDVPFEVPDLKRNVAINILLMYLLRSQTSKETWL